MKTEIGSILILLCLTVGITSSAQDSTPSTAGAAAPAQIQDGSSADSSESAATREELEAKLKETLENVTFTGRWSSIRDGELGPGRDEKYSIVDASKIGTETWVIRARIQYGDRDFVAPVPVKVKWAGDTPVITVDDLAMPGSTNKYSARVLIYGQAYAGRWSGGEHGGLLNGVIKKNEP